MFGALRAIRQLPFEPGQRYMEDPSGGHALCLWIHRGTYPLRLRLADIRKEDLPLIDARGRLKPLTLAANEGIAESTHMVIFEPGVVGCEFNFHGPRIGRLPAYLGERGEDEAGNLYFEPMFSRDAVRLLRNLREIKVFDLKIPTALIPLVTQRDPPLGRALRAMAAASGASTVALTAGPEAYSRGEAISPRMLTLAVSLAQSGTFNEEASRFVVTGFGADGQINEIDVLRGKLLSEERMVFQDEASRAVNTESAYSAIEEAYARVRESVLEE